MYTKPYKPAMAAMLLGTTLFATSCDKDNDKTSEVIVEKPQLNEVGFALTPMTVNEWKTSVVDLTAATRAKAQGDKLPELLFAQDDMLYVEGFQYDQANNPIANCLGNLTMDSGAGQKEATFSGELYAPEGTTLDDFEDITYYLIGANDKRVKLIDVEGTDVKAVELPLGETHIVSSFSEAIEKYSEIGFLAPKFTNEVKLQQSNAYFVFNLYLTTPEAFDKITAINVTFIRPDGTTLVVTTEEQPTGFKVNEAGYIEIVAPCDIEKEKELFADIKLEVKAENGLSLEKSFPSTSASGNAVEHGEVYILDCTTGLDFGTGGGSGLVG